MASPCTSIHREVPSEETIRSERLEELSSAMAEHSTSLVSLLSFIDALEDSGILAAATAILQSKEDILSIALDELTKPATINAIQSALSIFQTLQQVDGQHVKSVLTACTQGLEAGHQHVESKPEVSLFDVMRAFRDPATSRSMSLVLGAMKGFGESVGSA